MSILAEGELNLCFKVQLNENNLCNSSLSSFSFLLNPPYYCCTWFSQWYNSRGKKRNDLKEFSHLPVLWSTLCLISLHFPAETPDESVRARWIWINTGAREMWIYEPWLTPWTLAEPSIPISWADSHQLTVHKAKRYRHKYDCSSKMPQFFKN